MIRNESRRPRFILLLSLILTLLLAGCRVVTSGNYTLESGKQVNGNLIILSGNVVLEEDSQVTGSVWMTSGNLISDGEVGGDVLLTSGNFNLGPQAVVHGNVTLLSGAVNRSEGAIIEGDEGTAFSFRFLSGVVGTLCVLPVLLLGLLVLLLTGRNVPATRSEEGEILPASPGRLRSNSAGLVIGLLMIGLGALFLADQFLQIGDITWPFFVIFAGMLFFIGMLVAGPGAAGLAVPGAIITTVGLILLYQNSFDHYESWAYAWALVFPTAVGFGMMIQGAWGRRPHVRRDGARLALTGLVIFAVAAAFFELALDLSGFGGIPLLRTGWPVLLILLGVILLLRQIMRMFSR